MNAYDRLPEAVTEIFGEDATAEHSYQLLTVDVPADSWTTALETARDTLGCTYFDWLSAVDEPGTGFRVCAHVVSLEGAVRRLLVRTTVPHAAAELPTAVGIYAGASWHERETHEMFGISFTDHPHLTPLLLPEGFEGHPLRKDFVLAARVVKAWPGAKEPGESTASHGGARRRQMLPPGVPDPNEWGPQKGQLPPAPARPARTPRAAGDRPVRRAREATGDATSRATGATGTPGATETPTTPGGGAATGSTRATGAGPTGAEPEVPTNGTSGNPRPERGADAPWRTARPAPEPTGAPADAPAGEPTGESGPGPAEATGTPQKTDAEAGPGREAGPAPAPGHGSGSGPAAEAGTEAEADAETATEPGRGAPPGSDTPAGGDTA